MEQPSILVVGATGHVGSQIVTQLADAGHIVRALVRKPDDRVMTATKNVEYIQGDLADRASLRRAVDGIGTVISTANAIVPSGRTQSIELMADDGYTALIEEAERAGVRHFIQSSVPSHALESKVPELAGKRRIEARLAASPMATTVVRNPAFTDVWLAMTGAGEAANPHPHATTSRPHGFSQTWMRLTRRLVSGTGILLAPGGAKHGAAFITTEDVAHMIAGMVGRQDAYNRVVEAGGPEWLTWGQVAELLSQKSGRRVRVMPVPSAMAAVFQTVLKPIAPSASSIMGLIRYVARHQPAWQASPVVAEFDLPRQTTMKQYLDKVWNGPKAPR